MKPPEINPDCLKNNKFYNTHNIFTKVSITSQMHAYISIPKLNVLFMKTINGVC